MQANIVWFREWASKKEEDKISYRLLNIFSIYRREIPLSLNNTDTDSDTEEGTQQLHDDESLTTIFRCRFPGAADHVHLQFARHICQWATEHCCIHHQVQDRSSFEAEKQEFN